LAILRQRPCLFVGFSFIDPAITQVLDAYKKYAGPDYPTLHAALIPQGTPTLEARLSDLNIKAYTYDGSNEHKALWQAIIIAASHFNSKPKTQDQYVSVNPQFTSFQRFFAFAYTQTTSTQELRPL